MRAAVSIVLFSAGLAAPLEAQTSSPDVTIPPMTFAVVPSKAGTRVSMLTGFNLRGRR